MAIGLNTYLSAILKRRVAIRRNQGFRRRSINRKGD